MKYSFGHTEVGPDYAQLPSRSYSFEHQLVVDFADYRLDLYS